MKVLKRFLEFTWGNPECITADDVPYSDTLSTKQAIDTMAGGMNKNGVDSGEVLTIPNNYHKIVQKSFYVDGDLIVDGDFLTV